MQLEQHGENIQWPGILATKECYYYRLRLSLMKYVCGGPGAKEKYKGESKVIQLTIV